MGILGNESLEQTRIQQGGVQRGKLDTSVVGRNKLTSPVNFRENRELQKKLRNENKGNAPYLQFRRRLRKDVC
jgi:hypothetical protein